MEHTLVLNPPLVRMDNPARILTVVGLVAITAALPGIVHALGLNGAAVLPMHWTVLLCGLVFGSLGGFAAGALSPALSFMLSGLPGLPVLLPMTLEAAAYGLFAGLFRKLKLDTILSTFLAMILGRLVFTLMMYKAVLGAGNILTFWNLSFMPGLAASLVMLAVLPFAAYGVGKLLGDKSKSGQA